MAKEKITEADVAEEQPEATPTPAPVLTEDEMKAKVQSLMAAGDFNAAKALLTNLAKGQKDKDKAELEAKQAALKEVNEEVKLAIQKLVQGYVSQGKLDKADHVKFYQNLTDSTKDVECSLFKSAQAKARSGGGSGTGQKFAVRTTDLMAQYGDEPYKESGMSHSEAWEADSGGNSRYAVRMSLLKLGGYA